MLELLAAASRSLLGIKIVFYLAVLIIALAAEVWKHLNAPAPESASEHPRREHPSDRPLVRDHVTGLRVQQVRLNERALCPVCRTMIEPLTRVACSACRTPHHTECWRYNAGCATFACGERNCHAA